MSAAVRTFFRRLTNETIADVFATLGANTPDLLGLTPTKRASAACTAAMDGELRRGQIEAIVSEIAALTDKPDLAELALRAVCDEAPDMLTMLDSSLSLEERSWRVWKYDAKLIDRARNVVMKHHWQDGRFHCGFVVSNPGGLHADLTKAVSEIQTYIQSREGGRRAEADTFTYCEAQVEPRVEPSRIHHIAVYLERPARYLMEFGSDDDGVQPIIRHEARELAITYNERTGQIDVSGYGVGGQAVLGEIAARFHKDAIDKSSLETITRQDWEFDFFRTTVDPALSPPEGFALIRVTEIKLRARNEATLRASFKADSPSSAYHRMRDLGVSPLAMSGELVAGIALSLKTFPEADSEKAREVRIFLDWPARLKVDNATIAEKGAIESWVRTQPFAPRHS